MVLPIRDWSWLKGVLIKVLHFNYSKFLLCQLRNWVCLLRDKMKHLIVIVCPLFEAYWRWSHIFEAFLEAFLEIELHFESILKRFRSIFEIEVAFFFEVFGFLSG